MEIEVQATENRETAAIEIQNLSKAYGANKALDNISFSVKKGEVMGFLGPNGAGKSTTMNILTGYLAASKGKVLIDGVDVLENPAETRKKIGYLPEIPPLYTDMTVKEYLSFVYDLKGVNKDDKGAHLRKVMSKVRINEVSGRLIGNLSKGYRQRVGLAQALIGDPEVLVLDEPTVGLDPRQIMEIREVISELGKNRTVILSTHILQEVSAVCDSYTIINKGKIVASGEIGDLEKGIGGERYILTVKGNSNSAIEVLSAIENIENVEIRKEYEDEVQLLISAVKDTDIREDVFNCLAKENMPMLSFSTAAPSLEEMFMQIISSENTQEITEEETAETKEQEDTENDVTEEEKTDESHIE